MISCFLNIIIDPRTVSAQISPSRIKVVFSNSFSGKHPELTLGFLSLSNNVGDTMKELSYFL